MCPKTRLFHPILAGKLRPAGPPYCGRTRTDYRMMKFVTWNVMDNPKSDRPERRTGIVARELARYDINIASLNETRFPEEGQLREVTPYSGKERQPMTVAYTESPPTIRSSAIWLDSPLASTNAS